MFPILLLICFVVVGETISEPAAVNSMTVHQDNGLSGNHVSVVTPTTKMDMSSRNLSRLGRLKLNRTPKKRKRRKARKRRNQHGTSVEDYEYNYDRDYDYSDEDGLDEDATFLEKMDNKMTKKFIITALVCVNVFLCCCCTCCMVCCTFCKQLCLAQRRVVCQYCDKIRCRDPQYRELEENFLRLGLDPPTYQEFEVLRDSAGIVRAY